MGISTGGSKGRQRSEINVTPLVDVVLVLLIIFLVTMPIMMKQVSLDVPRKLNADEVSTMTGKQLTILLKMNGDVIISDGQKDQPPIPLIQLAGVIRPQLDEIKTSEKLVFVDFCDGVHWKDVVSAMDQIRSIAKDKDHDEITVALKMRELDPTTKQPLVIKEGPGVNPNDVGCPQPPGAADAPQ